MDKIRDNIYLGNSHDAKHSKAELQAAGITAVLNVAKDLTNDKLTHRDFELYHVGFMDGGGNNPIVCACALMLFNGLLQNGHKVMVHCHEGKSRSAALVAAHLMACGEFWDINSAESYLKSIRPAVEIKPELKELFTSLIKSSMK